MYLKNPGIDSQDVAVTVVAIEERVWFGPGMQYRYTLKLSTLQSEAVYECQVVLFIHTWIESFNEIKHNGCLNTARSVEKRGGGWSPADTNDDELLGLLEEVYLSGSSLKAEEVEVVAIEKQLVAGMNYRYTLELTHLPAHPIQCQVTIFHQQWTNTKQVTQDGCVFKRSVEKRAGGWSPADKYDEELLGLLNEVYFPGNDFSAEETYVTYIEKQVVAGWNYRYYLNVERLTEGKLENFQCMVVIFVQDWTNTKEVIHDDCQAPKRSVESRDGGWSSADHKDPELMSLLNEVYFAGNALSAENVEIVKIEKQLVAGTNYRYTLLLLGKFVQCQVVIYHQEWTGVKQVTKDECLSAFKKRSIPGRWEVADTNDETILGVLVDVLLSRSNVLLADVQVVAVKRQFLPPLGTNFKYTLRLHAGSKCDCHVTVLQYCGPGTGRAVNDCGIETDN